MRAILTPFQQRDAGVVIFKPGSELMGLFGNQRLLISTVPETLKDFPIGEVPAVSQSLIDDERLRGFFSNERVINAAGGVSGMKVWLDRLGATCQWEKSTEGYHDKNICMLEYGHAAVRMCWHHDHKYSDMILPELDRLAFLNQANFVISAVMAKLRLPQGHQLSFYELCWWAFTAGVLDIMPDSAARHALGWKPAESFKSTYRETEIQPQRVAVEVLQEHAEKVKPVFAIAIDPESPESLMLRPKRRRWVNSNYTQWVKRQTCCGCGNQADDPHHIIGNGFGGMATKAHDLFVIPLCRRCHDRLHANAAGWEEENGSQALLALKTIDSALAIGVIATGKAK